jgi:hypothetical protein
MPISSAHNHTPIFCMHCKLHTTQCQGSVHSHRANTPCAPPILLSWCEYLTCTHYIPTLCMHQQIFSVLCQYSMCMPCAPILCMCHKLCTVQCQILVLSPTHQYYVCATNSAHAVPKNFSVHTCTHHYFSIIFCASPTLHCTMPNFSVHTHTPLFFHASPTFAPNFSVQHQILVQHI